MREKIGPSLIVGLQGTTLTADETEFLIRENIGGIILFKRNFESPKQVFELSQELRSVAKRKSDKSPFFISVDQEGGRVARFRAPFTEWPPMAKVGEIGSPTVAFKTAQLIGTELAAVGINMNFAPSVDIFTNPANTVIGDRSLSSDPEVVAKLSSALVRGFIKSGVIPVAKHFPGHGNTLLDSHEDLPIENKTEAELDACELEPFKKVFRARLDAVMSSHILFPEIDPDWPASLSEVFLKNILRDKLRWRGLTITDDLDMKALTKHRSPGDIAVRALQAGSNILLYCNEPDSPRIAIDAVEKAVRDKDLPPQTLLDNAAMIQQVKTDWALDARPLEWAESELLIGAEEHQAFANALRSGSVPASMLA
ncbi:MAG: beta-N-acetylhexosaminidase [Bdellovibrionales bacterium]|jgi:beta-N-acetylhexosaminidase|nr:beta-N-acetylhexosaminidase [Bdellovibrionales bacterium]